MHSDRIHFFPVRHHSPACARAVYEYAMALRPQAILIEGPSEYNPQREELFLSHQLPLAIYTYVASDDHRAGAYHPFCEYSPEWRALQAAKDLKCEIAFIDLPWPEICALRLQSADEDVQDQEHRYADGELRRSRYIQTLCQTLKVEDFDAAWDELFEIDPASPVELQQKVAAFCLAIRTFEDEDRAQRGLPPDPVNQARERYMAERIRDASERMAGDILVVTGGFHTSALSELIKAETLPPVSTDSTQTASWREQGAALTPYSYARLDALTGYQSGMPGPEFYHQVWLARSNDTEFQTQPLVDAIAQQLRQRKLTFSTADRIAAECSVRTLAAMRGHPAPWRQDLFDGLSSATIKDELAHGGYHPMHEVIHEVFRGGRQGRLHDETSLPPLARDIDALLRSLDLWPTATPRLVSLNLLEAGDLQRNRILRRLQLLNVAGFELLSSPDFVARDDLMEAQAQWKLQWSPEFDAGKIEASRYGASLEEAANQRLLEMMRRKGRLADTAELLILTALCGLARHTRNLTMELTRQTSLCSDFVEVVSALNHLSYLQRYDDILEWDNVDATRPLSNALYERALFLLDSLGRPDQGFEFVEAIRTLLHCHFALSQDAGWSKEPFADSLQSQCKEPEQSPEIRGAALGGCFMLGVTPGETIIPFVRQIATSELGDFLVGLFRIARETVQRHPDLINVIHQVVQGYDAHEFMQALPSLRLAFTYFTPREKLYLADHLPGIAAPAHAGTEVEAFTPELKDIEDAMRFENALLATARDYGIDLETAYEG
ncbi:hypothetical protein EUZ85_17685 [Hahella sp. KA22]|uniref:DUF5682 family protein n=1 Tax=Hahella sp. KA22 TaxID=1628392 RepID=UPI000FDDE6EC|nr:DUF5682 family protein [Hahella sp. KA22]AZZ92451.1 hypothetical protein ENC22_15110 [Hahella sp. KA22]QAY55825.1 hypothetical protein EUZ85_17685 [Hahella sp. KA22]